MKLDTRILPIEDQFLELCRWSATSRLDGRTFCFRMEANVTSAVPFSVGDSLALDLERFAFLGQQAARFLGLGRVYEITAQVLEADDGDAAGPEGRWVRAVTGWAILVAGLDQVVQSRRVLSGGIFIASWLDLWMLHAVSEVISVVWADEIESLGGVPFCSSDDLMTLAENVGKVCEPYATLLEERYGSPFARLEEIETQ